MEFAGYYLVAGGTYENSWENNSVGWSVKIVRSARDSFLVGVTKWRHPWRKFPPLG